MTETTAKTTAAAGEKTNGASDANSLLVVELRKKHKRKHIKRLRKGRGRLLDEVKDLVDDLREEGTIDDQAQPIVIVVREKSRDKFRFKL